MLELIFKSTADSTTIGSPSDAETSSQSTPTKEPARQHNFISKVILKQELCIPCNTRYPYHFVLPVLKDNHGGFSQRIRFGKSAMKCVDCYATCHVDCKDKMAAPCTPAHKTPTLVKATLCDYAPKSSPMVPALITICISEIEARGVGYSGLYKTEAHEKEVASVKVLDSRHMPRVLLDRTHFEGATTAGQSAGRALAQHRRARRGGASVPPLAQRAASNAIYEGFVLQAVLREPGLRSAGEGMRPF